MGKHADAGYAVRRPCVSAARPENRRLRDRAVRPDDRKRYRTCCCSRRAGALTTGGSFVVAQIAAPFLGARHFIHREFRAGCKTRQAYGPIARCDNRGDTEIAGNPAPAFGRKLRPILSSAIRRQRRRRAGYPPADRKTKCRSLVHDPGNRAGGLRNVGNEIKAADIERDRQMAVVEGGPGSGARRQNLANDPARLTSRQNTALSGTAAGASRDPRAP